MFLGKSTFDIRERVLVRFRFTAFLFKPKSQHLLSFLVGLTMFEKEFNRQLQLRCDATYRQYATAQQEKDNDTSSQEDDDDLIF